MWKGKKKAAVYIRRSKGESGDTKAQLERIKNQVKALAKDGKINPVNFDMVGRQFSYPETATGKKGRFNPSIHLALKGDVFNEGDGQSAFGNAADRSVLNELLRRMRAGEYDLVLAESLDRFSRDPLDFATVALDLWRVDKNIFWGLSDQRGYGTQQPFNEAIITTQLMWGGETKKQEGKKSISALEAKLDRGFITSRMKAEFIGSGSKNAGLDYRRFWKIAQAYGDNKKGRLTSPSKVGEEFRRDHTWASNTYEMFKQWNSITLKNDLTALEAWFNTIDAINEFILNLPSMQKVTNFKSEAAQNLMSNSNGFINYPAGFSPSDKYPQASKEFIQFPYPLDFSFEELSMTKKPQDDIQGWEIMRTPITKLEKENLLKYQTQFRSKK